MVHLFSLFFTTYSNKPLPQEKCWEDGNYISPSGLECIYTLYVIGTGGNVAVPWKNGTAILSVNLAGGAAWKTHMAGEKWLYLFIT
jgi:hypothetical protein